MAKGLLSDPGQKQQRPKQGNRAQRQEQRAIKQFGKATAGQQRNIIQGQGQALQDQTAFNNQQFEGVKNAYSQPFDLSGLPQAPVADEGYRQSIEQANIDRFNRQYDKQFKQEMSDFEQMAGERGWVPGSEVYEKEKTRMQNAQNTARENAIDQARISGGQEMANYYNLQDRTRSTARDEYIAGRDRPFQEYSAMQGQIASNPLWNQWSQQSQQNFQGQQAQADRDQAWKIANLNRGGGGGGGGGGGAAFQQYGFSSPQEYDQYKLDQAMRAKEAEYQLAQKYSPKQKSVSPYAQLGGGILGAFANGFASNLGKGIFGG